jgi:hypothetical protein
MAGVFMAVAYCIGAFPFSRRGSFNICANQPKNSVIWLNGGVQRRFIG